MKLDTQDREFRNPKLFYPDPKNVDLDRILIVLFMLLRCKGSRPVTTGRHQVEFERIEHHARVLAEMPGVRGFAEHPEIAQAWLESDVFDLVNRGKPNQAVASLRPLHLDAFKIRVARHCRDYNHADALYAMLSFGDRQALSDLERYLDRGRDAATRRYDGREPLDLETLTVLKLVGGLEESYRQRGSEVSARPVCIGQARVLCDDVQRILAYGDAVPRPVMIDYLKTIFGLHLALYTLRLSRQLNGWIRDLEPHPTCRECPVRGEPEDPFARCPYRQYLTVDMGGDFRTRMAQLAQESAAAAYGDRLLELIKSMFTMNQLLRHAREDPTVGVAEDPFEVLRLLKERSVEFDADFRARLRQLHQQNTDAANEESVAPELKAIFEADELAPFERFIEVVTHLQQRNHMKYLREDLDKLLQKNSESGALVQGQSRGNPRRWHLGGRLLEVLVQLAVLDYHERQGRKLFYSQPILIDDFQRWLEERYGFVVGIPHGGDARAPVTVEEHRAFHDNVRALKDCLREIGFYDDLSDAYNAQTLRPRYPIDLREAA